MKIKLLVLSLVSVALLSGCTATNYVKGLDSLGKDNSMIEFDYSGVYGPIKYRRINPKPGYSVTVNTDGSVQYNWVGGSITNK